MIPLVINDNVSRLIQINLESSVGTSGRNRRQDVKTVQAILNATPASLGGPATPLKPDGLCGQLTQAAITGVQKALKCRVIDGRVDPLGPTITALGQALNSRGLLRTGNPGISAVDGRVQAALSGTLPPSPPSRGFMAATETTKKFLGPTGWKYVTSQGLDITVGVFGYVSGVYHMEQDRYPGYIRRFKFTGVGVGLSKGPFVGGDISFPDTPSWGTSLRQGFLGSNPLPEEDIKGACTIFSAGGGSPLFNGISGSLSFYRATGIVLPTATAIGFSAGENKSIPGVGVMMSIVSLEEAN
jgi:hypothetical protein